LIHLLLCCLQDFYICHRDELMLASDVIKPLLSVLVLCGKLAFPSEWKQFTSGFMDAPMLCLLRPVAIQVSTLVLQRCLDIKHSRSFVARQSPASGACPGAGSQAEAGMHVVSTF
jgi:hypothetical protein